MMERQKFYVGDKVEFVYRGKRYPIIILRVFFSDHWKRETSLGINHESWYYAFNIPSLQLKEIISTSDGFSDVGPFHLELVERITLIRTDTLKKVTF